MLNTAFMKELGRPNGKPRFENLTVFESQFYFQYPHLYVHIAQKAMREGIVKHGYATVAGDCFRHFESSRRSLGRAQAKLFTITDYASSRPGKLPLSREVACFL